MKKRLLFYQIMPYLEHKNALVITGMRQVGKTTLMRQLFDAAPHKNKLWFDFDNPLDQKTFEDQEYRNIYARLQGEAGRVKEPLLVCIDEIQNFPEITKIIKFLIDHYSVKFIVTGSSSFYLKNLFPESLSGRKFLYPLEPMSFQEYLYFHDRLALEQVRDYTLERGLRQRDAVEFQRRDQDYADFIRFGGFPEVVVTEDHKTKTAVLKNIFASFFEKDLTLLSDYRDIRELRDLILLLVPRVGSMMEVSKLASELGMERVKLYGYLAFLQGTFFIRLLPKFSRSVDRSVAGGKKIYFADTGLLNVIGPVNDGQLFENAVINQLAGWGELSFYKRGNGGRNGGENVGAGLGGGRGEIDVIIDKKIALEIKLNGTKQDVGQTKKLAATIGIGRAFVVSRSFRDETGLAFPVFI